MKIVQIVELSSEKVVAKRAGNPEVVDAWADKFSPSFYRVEDVSND